MPIPPPAFSASRLNLAPFNASREDEDDELEIVKRDPHDLLAVRASIPERYQIIDSKSHFRLV